MKFIQLILSKVFDKTKHEKHLFTSQLYETLYRLFLQSIDGTDRNLLYKHTSDV